MWVFILSARMINLTALKLIPVPSPVSYRGNRNPNSLDEVELPPISSPLALMHNEEGGFTGNQLGGLES
jgi:hypothetical protein